MVSQTLLTSYPLNAYPEVEPVSQNTHVDLQKVHKLKRLATINLRTHFKGTVCAYHWLLASS